MVSQEIPEKSREVGREVANSKLKLESSLSIVLGRGVDPVQPGSTPGDVNLPEQEEAASSVQVLPSTTTESEFASTRVFNTVELLTMILKYCPEQTLLCDAPRVNRTWKSVIDTNKNIQHYLFLQPWGEGDYWYTYAKINPFLPLLGYSSGENPEPGCFMDWGPGPDGDSDDEDWRGGDWREDEEVWIYHEWNWRKIEKDERFIQPEASWRRMLPMLPPPREIWNCFRANGDYLEGKRTRSMNPDGKGFPRRMGEIYADVLSLEEDIRCRRTRAMLRSSERYHVALQINIEILPINSEKDMIESWKSRF